MKKIKATKRVASLTKAYKQVCNGYLRLDRQILNLSDEVDRLKAVNKKLRKKIRELGK